MEKRIEELEESVKVLARYMKSELEKLEALSKVDHRAPLDSKVAMLSKEVAEIRKMVEKTAQYSMKEDQLREVSEQNLEEMLEEVKPLGKKIESELEEETIERISFDKSVSDIKQRLAVLESNVRSLNEKQYTEKNIEHMSQKFLASGLSEFSKELDRVYPSLATKTEFEKFSAQIERKVDMIEVPDMSHIERKVNELENKVVRLLRIIEELYNRLPAVVE